MLILGGFLRFFREVSRQERIPCSLERASLSLESFARRNSSVSPRSFPSHADFDFFLFLHSSPLRPKRLPSSVALPHLPSLSQPGLADLCQALKVDPHNSSRQKPASTAFNGPAAHQTTTLLPVDFDVHEPPPHPP